MISVEDFHLAWARLLLRAEKAEAELAATKKSLEQALAELKDLKEAQP